MDTSMQDTTLRHHIEELQKRSKAPADVRARMQHETEQLIRSGIAEQSLAVGETAPDFSLPNARGTTTTLSTLLAQGPVVLTFYRGEWCPYCNLTLHAYQRFLPQLQALGANLIAVSPQTPDHSLSTAEKWHLDFEVVSDVGNTVARAYGLVFSLSQELRAIYTKRGNDLAAYNGDDSWELPMAGTFVIAQDGTIRVAFVDADHTHRLEPAAILDALTTLRA
ncbi:peroxiredoxin-like family protein [Dictyobacter formicarum]|uniref:thioredoxin-dependent peroxiredoxin n=1 Tax=Dictyobacter formicarum TaxID=2778368 RepID=A0ABQ3VAV6_9CHLR|nr:peroxiredoxin-like family protein [Dictyobacter formicarum]GHO82548.1 alkyl hydroperoxide reductase [Dictyobacter formicarum]